MEIRSLLSVKGLEEAGTHAVRAGKRVKKDRVAIRSFLFVSLQVQIDSHSR
jgi:hypothetical protein